MDLKTEPFHEFLLEVDWERDLHKFKLGNLRILLDVGSGSVHIIDKITWDLLGSLEEFKGYTRFALDCLQRYHRVDELKEVISELSALKDREVLFTKDTRVQSETEKHRNSDVKSICLHTAHDCNMKCGYCFAGAGSFGGKREKMSREAAEAAVEFLLRNSGDRKNLEIDFFGGEPLLNFDVIKHITQYSAERAKRFGKNISHTLTTNGVLLQKEVIDFVNRNNIQVILSFDGRKEVNDKVRSIQGNSEISSYDTVVPKMRDFVKSRHSFEKGNYYVRGTYTRENIDFSLDVFHIMSLGFEHVSLEPAMASPQKYGFREEDIPALEKEYERLAVSLVEKLKAGKEIDFFHFNIDLTGGPCLPKRIRGCGAGFEYFAVAADGSIFPCHQFVGIKGYNLGDVFSGLQDNRCMEKFRSAHIFNKEKCQKCWARFICSGGCHANAYFHSGNLLEPSPIECSLQRKRIECGIYFQMEKIMQEQKLADQLVYLTE